MQYEIFGKNNELKKKTRTHAEPKTRREIDSFDNAKG